MKKIFVSFIFSIISIDARSADYFPKEVQKFIDKREGCDHMRGDMPDRDEKQRMKEVNREIRLLCKGTDKALIQLKKKYAGNVTILRRLNEFDEGIEGTRAVARK